MTGEEVFGGALREDWREEVFGDDFVKNYDS